MIGDLKGGGGEREQIKREGRETKATDINRSVAQGFTPPFLPHADLTEETVYFLSGSLRPLRCYTYAVTRTHAHTLYASTRDLGDGVVFKKNG